MSQNYSDSDVQRIKEAVPISEVVGQFVSWDQKKSSQGDMWGCCPFHNDSDPSFHAHDEKGIYKCFSCQESGDHFQFLQKNQGMTFPEAVAYVAELAGMSNSPAQSKPKPRPQEAPHPANDDVEKDDEGKLKPICAYDYHDPDRGLLYQVVRYHWKLPDGTWRIDPKTGNPAKTFRQRRKNERGEVVYNLDGIGHTIYHHPQVEIAISENQTVFLLEGEKDADTLTEWEMTATTNSGGIQHWNETHASYFRDADVVIVVDNDDAGRVGGQKRAQSLKGIARRIRLLDFSQVISDFGLKLDVTDWKERYGGTKDKLLDIVADLPDWQPAPPPSAFRAVGLADLNRNDLKHDNLVLNFLDRTGVAMMPGESGTGKSFLTIHIGLCVATGRDFFGMETKPGLVIYQAGEGAQGAAKRLTGWLQENEIPENERASIPFRMFPRKVNLFIDDKDTDAIIKEAKELSAFCGQPVRLVVFDTFNKMITGASENDGRDMGKVISRMERISEELDCLVLSPIHKSKQGQMRGHSSLRGDASNVLDVMALNMSDANDRPINQVVVDKNKDGARGAKFRFVLREVVVGEDEKRRPVTTLVVEKPDGATEEQLSQKGKLSMDYQLALNILRDVISAAGVDAPAELSEASDKRRVVEYREWQNAIRSKWFFKSDESDAEARARELKNLMTRVGKGLLSAGYINRGTTGPEESRKTYVWWTGKEDRVFRRPEPIRHTVPQEILDQTEPGKAPF